MAVKVTVSGTAGSGKTHVLAHIETYLKEKGFNVTCAHEEITEEERFAMTRKTVPETIRDVVLVEHHKHVCR